MKTKNRIPSKILSVLLCILMLTTTLCIVNPFTASAATRITHTPKYTDWYSWNWASADWFKIRNVERYGSTLVNTSLTAGHSYTSSSSAIYDFNPNAINYTVYTDVSGYKTISYPSDMYVSPSATTSSNRFISIRTTSMQVGYNQGYAKASAGVSVTPINTTNMMNAYDTAMNNYGTSNPGYYTNDSWEAYINALNYVKGIINKGVLRSFESNRDGTDLQNFVYRAEQRLRSGMRGLQKIEVTIGNVFKSVDGAIITGPERIGIGDTFNSIVRLTEGYTQSVPGVRVTYDDGTTQDFNDLTAVGNDTYHIPTRVTGTNVSSIMPINVSPNIYDVTVPGEWSGLEIENGGAHRIQHGKSFTFTLTKKTGYTQTVPTVYVNGSAFGGVDNGDGSYTYTIERISENKTVTFGTQPVNGYNISYNTGEGTTAEGSPANIEYFDTKEIKITVGEAYTQSEPQPTVDNGTLTFKEKDGNTYIYTLGASFDDEPKTITVTVPSLKKNTYSAALPSGTGYKVTHKDAVDGVVSGIVYGTDLAFGVELDPQYNRSDVVVKYNGTPLEPDGGVYTIPNVRNNIGIDAKDPEITVEGVKLNNYYITLPLESGTGFTIEVGKDANGNQLNAKSVLSGTDFNFKFFLDPAYSDSTPTIKVSRDGGNSYTVINEKDGKYDINEVLSDCIVVVDGVEKNTYTVKFLDGNGDVDETVENVEYGSEVKYPGKNDPEKDAELISDNTDPETGIRTVVTKEYKFIGWSQDTTNVTSNMEVSPIFEVSEVTKTYPKEGGEPTIIVTPKTANVLFISDGVIVHKETVEKETKFAGWNGEPVKASSNPYEKYEFLGWDTDKDGVVDIAKGESTAIDSVKDDVMFVAVFKSNLPTQKVSFFNFDGSDLLYSADVKRGEKAEYALSAIPSRTDDANVYDFAGWSFNKDADETDIVENLIVGESDINLYAAYEKTPIVYSYKYVDYDYDKVTGKPEPFQEGTFYFTDDDKPSYKYLGVIPTRESDVDKVYAFDGWNVKQNGYTTVYTATYKDSVREYDSKLPTPDGTYSITEDARVKYGDTFTFTVTLTEGYTETEPNVTTASGETLTPASTDGNSYTYEIKLDGKTTEEVENDLTVSVETKINNYDVSISGDEGCEVEPTSINSNHGGNGSFTVTLKEGYTQTAPALSVNGEITVSEPEVVDGKYVFTISDIKSDAEITVSTVINVYDVKLSNYDGTVIFHDGLTHGSTPEYTNPTQPNDKFGGYTFIGWDLNGDGVKDVDKIENVKSDIDAVAVYECNHVHADDPDADDSAWTLVSTDKATCTASGAKHYKCSYPGCAETTDKEIPARGHNMTAWNIDKAPTCTETGRRSCFCQNGETDEYKKCNHKVSEIIPATGHHDADGDYKCDDCGADLGHCSSCICHKGNVLSKVIRRVCTLLSKIFRTEIKCCKCMEWYGDEISSIS